MYNPLQFFKPVNARFDLAGQMATQISEQNRLRDGRAKQQAGEQRFLGLQQLGQYQPEELEDPQVQGQMEQAKMDMLGGGDKYLNYQLMQERAKNVGRRGITGNAQANMNALQSQNPLVANLTNLERELGMLEQGTPEYQQKYTDFQKAITEHDSFAVNNNQLWHQKTNTRNTEEEFEENKRKQAEEARKAEAFTNVEFTDFRKNWQANNRKLVDSSKLVGSMGSNIPSASKGNTQSVSTLVKKMARLASNEAITMPELELGFSGNAEAQAKAWIDKWTGSGNRIPARELRAIKVTYNEQAQYYNDKLEEIIGDAVMDWQKYNPKAKKSTRGELQRQLMGQTFKRVPLWTANIDYKDNPSDNPSDNPPPPKVDPNAKSDRSKGDLPDAKQKEWDKTNEDKVKLNQNLLKLMDKLTPKTR